jgi:hypothetical protein
MTPRHPDRSLPDPNTEPTISIPRAGRILGMSRNAAYAAARDGRLPTVAISASRLVVITAEFLEKYRLRPVPSPVPHRPAQLAQAGRVARVLPPRRTA